MEDFARILGKIFMLDVLQGSEHISYVLGKKFCNKYICQIIYLICEVHTKFIYYRVFPLKGSIWNVLKRETVPLQFSTLVPVFCLIYVIRKNKLISETVVYEKLWLLKCCKNTFLYSIFLFIQELLYIYIQWEKFSR